MHHRPKPSPLFYALACVTLALSSWGLFRLFVDYAHMPPALAAVAVGGLDIVAVLCGKQALTVAADGDSSAPWNAALMLFTALGAFAQFAHARLAGDPTVIGITMAAFPVATVLLFEGQLRRSYRLSGRAAGRLAEPRATVDFVTWLFYPKVALAATKLAVLDRGLDSDTALALAERKVELAAQAPAVTRRKMRRSYGELLTGGRLKEIAPVTVEDEPEDVPAGDVRTRGVLSGAVKAAYAVHGDDLDAVLSTVRESVPDAKTDSVRRTLGRLIG